MKAVTDYVEPGKLELMAIKAGNDVLLLPVDAKLAVKTIEKGGQIRRVAYVASRRKLQKSA